MVLTSCEKKILPWEVNDLLSQDGIKGLNKFIISEAESDFYYAEFHSFTPESPKLFYDTLTESGWGVPQQEDMRIFKKLIPAEHKVAFLSNPMRYKEADGRRCFIIFGDGGKKFYCVVAFPKH